MSNAEHGLEWCKAYHYWTSGSVLSGVVRQASLSGILIDECGLTVLFFYKITKSQNNTK